MTPARIRITVALTVLIACFICGARAQDPSETPEQQGLDVYLIRHAESMGNVTGDYSEENQRTFSSKGLKQVHGIPRKLKGYDFDVILCSPTWRTRQTILPYLKAHNRTAEIWPEIEECCCDSRGNASPAAEIPRGEEIVITEEEAPYFKLRDEESSFRYAPETEADAVGQITHGCDLIREKYGQSGKTILLVTHSCTGSRIMEGLLGVKQAGRFAPANAALTHLRQEPSGVFRLMEFNDEPFEQRYYWILKPGKVPTPGEPLMLDLVPRYLAQVNDEGYRLDWRLRDTRRRAVMEGSELFTPTKPGNDPILTLTVPTPGARRGDMWSIYSTLYSGMIVVQQWRYDFLFPGYYPLFGDWLIREGDDTAWSDPALDDSDWPKTTIPGGWEKDALPGYDGTAWYRLRFTIPESYMDDWGTNVVGLVMGAIDDADETYLNGTLIGALGKFPPEKITAWDLPRLYEFDRSMLQPTNVIAIRVSDWGGGGGIWKGPVAIGTMKELADSIRRGIQY